MSEQKSNKEIIIWIGQKVSLEKILSDGIDLDFKNNCDQIPNKVLTLKDAAKQDNNYAKLLEIKSTDVDGINKINCNENSYVMYPPFKPLSRMSTLHLSSKYSGNFKFWNDIAIFCTISDSIL